MISRISKLLTAFAFLAALCVTDSLPMLAAMSDGEVHFVKLAAFFGILLFSLAFHESAHAWVADYYGDPTARMMGRVTMNPIKHLDFFWSFLMPLSLYFGSGGTMLFGGGKPVPVNVFRLRYFQLHQLYVAMAGPLSNVILFILFLGLSWAYLATGGKQTDMNFEVLRAGVTLNYVLAVFNALPIPPLDGFSIPIYLVDRTTAERLTMMKSAGIIPLIILMWSGIIWTILGYALIPFFYIVNAVLPGVNFFS